MKTILLLLLTCLPLWAATTYPMLSDTTNRTVTGGVTNLSFLNSNSVFTGTARWMGIVTLTNTGNIFVGDGSGLTGVGIPTSGGLATNLTATGLTVATGQTNTHLTASSIVTTDANKGIVSGTTTANLATLSANQTFTGTNTFNAFSIAQGGDSGWTNLRSFYRSTQLAYRVLLKTNFGAVQFFNANTNATSPSSNGGYAFCKSGYEVTIPPLLGSNSVLSVNMFFYKTNATSSAFTPLIFAGPSTNFASALGTYSINATDQRFAAPGFSTVAHLANADSYTLQWTYPVNNNSTLAEAPIAVVDTSIPFKIYIGFTSTTGATNLGFYGFQITEQVMSP